MFSLYLHLSALNLCNLISVVVVILFVLDCFINSMLSLCSFSAHTLFDNKIELVICNLGSKHSRCFTHYLSIQLVSERVHLLWFNYLSAILNPV